MLRDERERRHALDLPFTNSSLTNSSQTIEDWKAKLNKIEESHSCTTLHLNNLISMLRKVTEEHEVLDTSMTKEKETKRVLVSQLEYFKSQFELEKKRRKELQSLVKSNLSHLHSSSLLTDELLTSIEADDSLHESYSESQSQAVSPMTTTPILTEKLNRLSFGYESSLVSEDSTYRQTSGSKNVRSYFFEETQSSPPPLPPSPLHSMPFLDPLEGESPPSTTKWFKAKEVEEAIVELRKQKELLFKETESILLYKRELMAEIELLEHHKCILTDTKNGKSKQPIVELKKTLQKDLEVIRSNHQGLYFDASNASSSTSTHPEQQPLFSMSLFPSTEPVGPGAKEGIRSDSSSLLAYSGLLSETPPSLLSPTQCANRRASLDPYLHEPSSYSKRSKKNGKFQLGFSTVSNAIIKFKDKLSNDDNSVGYASLGDANVNALDACSRGKGSNTNNALKEDDTIGLENEYKPHLFGIIRLPAVLPCSVCHIPILEMQSMELRCLQCGVAAHARCVPLMKESCSTTSSSISSSISNHGSSHASSAKQRHCAHSVPSPPSVTSKLSFLPLCNSSASPSSFQMSSLSSSSYSSSSSSSSSSSCYSPKMFGVDLVTQCHQERRSIPLILEFCLSTVEAFGGLGFEGVYRKSGPAHCIRALVQAFDQGVIPDMRASSISPCSEGPNPLAAAAAAAGGGEGGGGSIPAVDVCVTTSVLKQYLRELPNPLITFAIYPVICNAIHKHPSKVKEALQASPKPHWDTLVYLFRHLKLVVEHAPINRMSSRNLGVVFGPTLMRHASHTDVYDMSGIQVVEYLLDHYTEVFGDAPSLPTSLLSPDLSPPSFTPVHHDRISCELHDTETTTNKKHRRVSVVF